MDETGLVAPASPPAKPGLDWDTLAAGGSVTALATMLPWVYTGFAKGWPDEMPGLVATAFAGVLVAMWRGVLLLVKGK